jgi:hypothetical protein
MLFIGILSGKLKRRINIGTKNSYKIIATMYCKVAENIYICIGKRK